MSIGEVSRRAAFLALDKAKGGKMNSLIRRNMEEIIDGVTPEYMERRLHMILDYAAEHTEFYGKIDPSQGLSAFPVMKKMDYNENRDAILSDEYAADRDSLAQLNTSGSTGVPFTVYADPFKMDHMKWKSFRNNLYMYDISNMGDAYLETVCERLRKERIQVIVAYSGALTALVQYIERKNIDVKTWSVEMIFSMGEAMPDQTYEAIERVFHFPPVRSYGNNENGFIAVCVNGDRRYTIDLYNYYVEILKIDSDMPAEEGELGRIVVTDYYNRAFPMIRYDTGDTGIMVRETGADGREHAYFTEIYGRRGSLLYNTKGEPLSIHVFMNLLLKQEGIVHQARCIQWEKNRYELLVNADREKLDEEALLASYRHYLGEDAVIDVTYVDEIPVQASGKTMVCENKCPDYI